MPSPRALASLLLATLLAGCAGVPLYQPPGDDQPVAVVTVSDQVAGQGGESRWPATAAVFAVDGVRVTEQGGARRVRLSAAEHRLRVFADHGGTLRFGTLEHRFEAGTDYLITIGAGGGAHAYQAVLSKGGSGVSPILDETSF
ncbi:hypothetical protein CEK62_06225 [Alcanivorax sp. N3-2A]|nr:hypothetical protein CEK62_06225 [Alcanivorax sp. N3-2A]